MKKLICSFLLVVVGYVAIGQTALSFLSPPQYVSTTLTFDTNKSQSVSGLNALSLNGSGNVFGVVITLTVTGSATLTSDFKILDGKLSGSLNYLTMTYFGANDVRVRIYQTQDGPTSFSPTLYSNNVLFLDGADATSVTDPGTLRWADKSVFANHALQSDATHKPTYVSGSKGFTFSTVNPGSFMYLTSSLTLNRRSVTMFFVFNKADASNQYIFSALVNGAALYVLQQSTNTLYSGRTISNVGSFSGNFVLAIRCTPTAVETFKNGTSDNSISANGTGTDLWDEIGTFAGSTSAQFRGLLESVVIYDRDLSTQEVTDVSNYLLNRFVTSTPFTFSNYINDDATVDVYFLAGQSNAQGHAPASALSSALQAAQLGAKIYDNDYNKLSDILAGSNTQTIAGDFGFEVTFTNSMVKYKGRNIYIIKYAVGSSYLGFTGSQDWNVATVGSGSLLTQFKAVVTKAFLVLRSQNKTPIPKGFLWMQGEQDATNLTYANAYLVNERALRDDLRSFLSAPTMPWVTYTIRGVSADAPEIYYATVNAAKTTLSSDANCYLIDTSSYTILPADRPHWDAPGCQQGGTDGFNVLKDL
jgi:hypothetical protein